MPLRVLVKLQFGHGDFGFIDHNRCRLRLVHQSRVGEPVAQQHLQRRSRAVTGFGNGLHEVD